MPHTLITEKDILPLFEFEKIRIEYRRKIVDLKKDRRVSVGPDITFYFENRETLLWQIQEMLFIEKGGEAQVKDELAAYNPLIPKGDELVATMMIEIDDMERRRLTLAQLGHIEDHIHITFGNHTITATPTDDVERTTEEGKTSAVHFLHFPFSKGAQKDLEHADKITLEINHPRYSYKTIIEGATLVSLKKDMSKD